MSNDEQDGVLKELNKISGPFTTKFYLPHLDNDRLLSKSIERQ